MKKDFTRSGKVPRTERLNSEFRKEIYEIISRKLNDPAVTEMVSVTKVDVSKDLSYAKVYISVYSIDETKKNATFNAVKSDAKKIRYELASSMRIRTVPELEILSDDSIEYGDKMDKLFAKIRKGDTSDNS